jgi:hypothetical protein
VQHGHDPFLRVAAPDRAEILVDALEHAAGTAIAALRAEHASTEINGWLSGALDAAVDARLRARFCPTARYVLGAPTDAGQLGTLAAAGSLAELLAQAADGRVPHGSVLLSWNASLGGTVCASLWRVNSSPEAS